MDTDTTTHDIAGLLRTLTPHGNITGPSCRVAITDNGNAILQLGSAVAGFDLAGLDALRAALDATRERMLAHTAPAWTPPADAPRTHAGDLKHTCNGSDGRPLPFGRLAPEGECARCDRTSERHAIAWRRAHRATCHACRIGGVCAANQW